MVEVAVSRKLSFWILLGVIFLLVIVFFRVMAGFLIPMFLASILCVVFGPLHNWIREKCNGRGKIAAAFTTAAIMLLVLAPIAVVITLAVLEGRELASRLDANSINAKVEKVRASLKLDLPMKTEFEAVEASFARLTGDVRSPDWHEKQLQIAQLEKSLNEFRQKWRAHRRANRSDDATGEVSPEIELYEQIIKAISECKAQLKTLSDADIDEEKKLEVETNYRSALDNANNQFRDLKTQILGGKFWAPIKELANPTVEEARQNTERIQSNVAKTALAWGGATSTFLFKMIFGICIMVISTYFFLLDGPKMIDSFKFLSPLDDEYEDELLQEFQNVSRAVVVATLASAIVQGLLAGIGYYFAGLNSVFLLMFLTSVLAMVPFVGAAAVWLPASLWVYFVDGRPGAAIGLAIYGAAIVSTADNVIKPLILHGQSNIHPLLALLSVLGGVSALGPIGILVGPMIVVFLQTLLKILQRELTKLDASETDTDVEAATAAES
jgi:predicted PurR-regulated permease PerM